VPETKANGIRLYYEEQGQGAPILCIHALGSSAVMWGEAVEKLAALGRTITYDRRGCGRSERPERYESTTVAEQADDAAALLADLDATPAVVIGRSYGGAVAIDLALRYADRVRALALLEGDALGLSTAGLEMTTRIRDRLREVADKDGADAIYRTLIEEFGGPGVWDSLPNEIQRILTKNGPAALAELHYVEEDNPDAAAFGAITQPTLLVAASESPPEQREMTEAMAEAFPSPRLVRVGGGHMIDPATPEVLAFIEEVLES
jgi:esterase